jgi:hypothetical protein
MATHGLRFLAVLGVLLVAPALPADEPTKTDTLDGNAPVAAPDPGLILIRDWLFLPTRFREVGFEAIWDFSNLANPEKLDSRQRRDLSLFWMLQRMALPMPPEQPSERVDLSYDETLKNADLIRLKRIKHLRTLNLAGTNITDAGLEHLKEFRELEELHLVFVDVTDAGLAHLEGLTQLRTLNLHETNVSDAGLKHLHGMKQLRMLYLGRTRVSDAGVAELRKALPDVSIRRGR